MKKVMITTSVTSMVISIITFGIAVAALVLVFFPPNGLNPQAITDINSLYDANAGCMTKFAEAEAKLLAALDPYTECDRSSPIFSLQK
tara:strand:+ start:1550 stop:1813 length:264 start_codon:yes stop_codon:yes gene_type:complete